MVRKSSKPNSCSFNKLFFALNYNGHVDWHEPDQSDALINQWFNEHQHTDKGFGPAAGPDSVRILNEHLKKHDKTFIDTSNWQLDASNKDLQLALLEGWKTAAIQLKPDEQTYIDQWAQRKKETILDNTKIQVGHLDFLALKN